MLVTNDTLMLLMISMYIVNYTYKTRFKLVW